MADGRVWFRYGGPACALTSARAARAAALAEVYGAARACISGTAPADVYTAQQQLVLDLATWRDAAEYPGLRIKARISLTLTPDNAQRADSYDQSLRAAHLEQELAAERLRCLAQTALTNVRQARVWWFEQHLAQGELLKSWESFDTVIRPMINDNTDDVAHRFAQVLATAAQRTLEDPDKAKDIQLIAHVLLTTVGWRDLAEELTADGVAQTSNGDMPT
ncbi:hypothetical protein ACIBQX_21065 [Nonomuraea sp. NPDC049714]|uniref:hypothetical protein n=1 Tax=Nonomuraea sp. NPDC049714 TaxID=3364357 RepID=UPI0037942D58